MTVEISGGRIVVTKGGVKRFDSADAMFHITNSYTGAIDIDAVGLGRAVVDRTDYFDIGAANAFASQIVGAVKFTLNNNNAGMAYDRWHSMFGGSICWLMDGEPDISDRRGSNYGFGQGVFYHFDISGGRARLVRRLVFAGVGSASYTILSHRINYQLRAGVWV